MEKSFIRQSTYSSIIDFNALPEAYRPKAIKLSRVLAPVAVVGENIHPQMTPFKVEEVLAGVRQKEESREAPAE